MRLGLYFELGICRCSTGLWYALVSSAWASSGCLGTLSPLGVRPQGSILHRLAAEVNISERTKPKKSNTTSRPHAQKNYNVRTLRSRPECPTPR